MLFLYTFFNNFAKVKKIRELYKNLIVASYYVYV